MKGIRGKYKSESTAVEDADTPSGTAGIRGRHTTPPLTSPARPEENDHLDDNNDSSAPHLLGTVLNSAYALTSFKFATAL